MAAGGVGLLSCLPEPLNLSDGQVAQSRSSTDLDARLDDPCQRVVGKDLRGAGFAQRVVAAPTAAMASAAAAAIRLSRAARLKSAVSRRRRVLVRPCCCEFATRPISGMPSCVLATVLAED